MNRILATALILSIAPSARALAHDPAAGARWPTVAELREEHSPEVEAELRELVWMTPLGLLVRDYLYSTAKPRHVNRLANRITYRMFSSGPLAIGRQTALVMMKRDLSERGLMDQRVMVRWSQLESDILLKKVNVEERSTDTLAYKLTMPVILGAMWGLPAVRNRGVGGAKWVIERMKSWRNDEAAAAMMTNLKYSAEGAGAGLAVFLGYHNFMATGSSHDEGLFRRYFNKWLQSETSIEYL